MHAFWCPSMSSRSKTHLGMIRPIVPDVSRLGMYLPAYPYLVIVEWINANAPPIMHHLRTQRDPWAGSLKKSFFPKQFNYLYLLLYLLFTIVIPFSKVAEIGGKMELMRFWSCLASQSCYQRRRHRECRRCSCTPNRELKISFKSFPFCLFRKTSPFLKLVA